jgi:hypothetical protein
MGGIATGTFWWQYTQPNTIPNLNVWYYANDGLQFNKSSTPIANNTNVTSWQNAGGLTSHDWNSTGGKRPTFFTPVKNGLGAVRFSPSATSSLTINPIAYMQSLSAVTMAILFKSSNTAAGTRIVSTTDTNGFRWGQNGTQWIGGFAGATFTVNTNVADTSWHQVLLKFDGSQTGNTNRFQARLDSTNLTLTFTGTVANTTSPTASTFYGGVDSTGNSNYFDGDIGELMFWTRALSSGEISTVEQYLKTKWAL